MLARRKFLMSGAGLAAALNMSLFNGGFARAEDGASFKKTGDSWPLRNSEAFEYHSKAVGDRMAIGIWSPSEADLARTGEKSPPLDVVYVLDGAGSLGMAAEICKAQYIDILRPGFSPVLLVGVDYPADQITGRSRDYTMPDLLPPYMNDALSTVPRAKPGGADNFLKFIEEELDPFIRSRYRTTNRPAGILGDSFGGTFTFYAFIKQSRLFDRYWFGSPGIFTTGTDYVARFEALLNGKLVNPTKLFLSMGSLEIDGGDKGYEDMGRNFKRLVSVLNKQTNRGLEWKSKIYDGYTHTSVLAPALNDALLYLYRKS